jgi:pimeloyl-ACP methyl ester carboxylesterase
MPTLQLGSASLNYREAGTGNEAVLLLHAFPLHSGMWEPQLAALSSRFRVIAPDHRGLGASRPAPAAATMDLISGDLLQLLRHLGVRRAAVAGASMGGYVALELYRRAPQLFAGLALVGSKAVPDTQEQKDGREAFARNALSQGISWVAADFTPKLLRPQADPVADATVRHLIAESAPEGIAAAQRGMASRPDSVPTLARIACPTIAVVGELDQITPFGEMQRIAQTVKGGRLLRIPAAGHLPNLEAPAAFNTALGAFCASVLGRPRPAAAPPKVGVVRRA